jgi:SAM-dependent methyltransferase
VTTVATGTATSGRAASRLPAWRTLPGLGYQAAHQAGTCWIARQTPEHLRAIREHEIAVVLGLLPAAGRVLEIGAGTGWQANRLAAAGYAVAAIDTPASNYAHARVHPVIDYDGHTIPFPDQSFDVVYSSNTLEHVPHVEAFQAEIHRVLRPGGVAIHLLPTASWRFWTALTEIARYWVIPGRHGEHARNCVDEMRYFGRRWWTDLFRRTGWRITGYRTNRLFYTGASVLDRRLGLRARAALGRVLGDSCHVFVLRGEEARA